MLYAIVGGAVGTSVGGRGGACAGWHAAELAGEVVNRVVERTGISPVAIEDVIMGCVGQAGEQSFQIGRNAVLASALPDSVPAVSIDRQCGSSQQAIQFAAQAVMSGTQDVVVAAGIESKTRVPMFSATSLALKAGLVHPMSPRMNARYGVTEDRKSTRLNSGH